MYDNTEKFLDYVCQITAFEIQEHNAVFFTSNNISFETILKCYVAQPSLPKLIYKEHFFYYPLHAVLSKEWLDSTM